MPAALLAALPALVLAGVGRSFTLRQLALAMPETFVLLAVAAAAGTAVTAARTVALRRARTLDVTPVDSNLPDGGTP